ncbi:acylphosphatase [Ramlibacter sp.]|uniref:acylphosphatase n=1 Tax=Ramlibacter sp. TaxID=1917967 RepID=UPI002FC67690
MAAPQAPARAARLVRVRGLVQGVGYRYACVQQARALGLTGWVRNRLDGSVEALLQGPPGQVERMCRWMHADVPGARVDAIEAREVPPDVDALDGFDQRSTV